MERTTRTKDKEVNLILSSDWHLRDDTPICRTDDFQLSQWKKVKEISKLQKRYQCPVICAGDLFHHWKASPFLIAQAIKQLPEQFHTIYGQHDLPQHNFELRGKAAIAPLQESRRLTVLPGAHWHDLPVTSMLLPYGHRTQERQILVWHKFVWDGKEIPWPGCEEMTAMEVLKKYPDYDLIVTGDHHKPFIQEYRGRLLVNPGCLTRQASNYHNHRPRVYLYNATDNSVEIHYLSIEEGVVSREHIEKKEEVDKRMTAFISRLNEEWAIGSSFEDNLKQFFSSNRVKNIVEKLVYKSLEI